MKTGSRHSPKARAKIAKRTREAMADSAVRQRVSDRTKAAIADQRRPRHKDGRHGSAGKARRLPAVPTNRDYGAIELAIAQRIGHDGFDVLMALPKSEVRHLCLRQKRGTLCDEAINRLRSGQPP